MSAADGGGERGFNRLLLGAVITMAVLSLGIVGVLYLRPPEHLELPGRQLAVRVAAADAFPVGASRTVSWGDRVVLVIHRSAGRYVALGGVSPADGCLLDWSPESLRVVSPCAWQVYDLQGRAVEGLTTEPLASYATYVRDGSVYVTEAGDEG